MKKKSPRGIPDFSRQPASPKGARQPDGAAAPKQAAPKAPQAPRGKPPGTSAKSGQRGT